MDISTGKESVCRQPICRCGKKKYLLPMPATSDLRAQHGRNREKSRASAQAPSASSDTTKEQLELQQKKNIISSVKRRCQLGFCGRRFVVRNIQLMASSFVWKRCPHHPALPKHRSTVPFQASQPVSNKWSIPLFCHIASHMHPMFLQSLAQTDLPPRVFLREAAIYDPVLRHFCSSVLFL